MMDSGLRRNDPVGHVDIVLAAATAWPNWAGWGGKH